MLLFSHEWGIQCGTEKIVKRTVIITLHTLNSLLIQASRRTKTKNIIRITAQIAALDCCELQRLIRGCTWAGSLTTVLKEVWRDYRYINWENECDTETVGVYWR